MCFLADPSPEIPDDPFFLALVDYERYEVQYPSCHGDWAGDTNQDARFDAADIDAFFKLLGGG